MAEGLKYTETVSLTTLECYRCGVTFGVPAGLQRRWRDHGDSFYCPNGHSQHYTKSEVDRLKERLEAETSRVQFWRDEEARRAKELTATKGKLTKARKRSEAGVCPCCQRSFVQMARHMRTKHPGFKPEAQP